MGYTKEQRIINSVTGTTKGKRNKKSNDAVSPNFVLPNNSGDHVKSIKRNDPVNDYDLVNKKYVDDATAGNYVSKSGDTMTGALSIEPDATGHTDAIKSIISGWANRWIIETYRSTAFPTQSKSVFSARAARGTEASPEHLEEDGRMFEFRVRSAMATSGDILAGIVFEAAGDHTDTSMPTKIIFQTSDDNETSGDTNERVIIHKDGDVEFKHGIKLGGTTYSSWPGLVDETYVLLKGHVLQLDGVSLTMGT